MTPEKLDELERLLKAGTPGPWYEVYDPAVFTSMVSCDGEEGAIAFSVKSFNAALICAAINALEELVAMARRVESDYAYAKWLLLSLHAKHFPDGSPDFKALPDLRGVLTQIDNLTTGLTRAALSRPAPDADWRALASRLNGLHAQMFGLASMDDPALAMKGIQDGGVLHEAVHDCLRALPVSAGLSHPAPDAPDAPGAEEVEAIRARHEEQPGLPYAGRDALEKACHASFEQAHTDRATLLRLLDAARAELAEERAKEQQG
jgi:hypothetical protein